MRFAKPTVLIVFLVASNVWAKGDGNLRTSFCESDEKRVWACVAKNVVYELCQSTSAPKGAEYVRYVQGTAGDEKASLTFPENKAPAKGLFTFKSTAEATTLQFVSGKFDYTLKQESADDVTINVRAIGSKLAVSEGEREVIYHCGKTDGDALSSSPFKALMISLGLFKK